MMTVKMEKISLPALSLAVVYGLTLLIIAESLEPYQLYTEGPCEKHRAGQAENVNQTVLEEMRFIVGGSRYILLRGASSHPSYSSLTEQDFLQSYCPQRNTTSLQSRSLASAYGFGRILSTYDVRTFVEPNVFVEAVSRNPSQSWDTLRQTVAYTDNRNYAFLVNCWTGSNQAGWTVISKSPTLTPEMRRIIRVHARGLRFNPENTVFFDNEECQMWGESRKDEGLQESLSHRARIRPETSTSRPSLTSTSTQRQYPSRQASVTPVRQQRLQVIREQKTEIQQEQPGNRPRGSVSYSNFERKYNGIVLGHRLTQLVTPEGKAVSTRSRK